jgi:hypothetical protein
VEGLPVVDVKDSYTTVLDDLQVCYMKICFTCCRVVTITEKTELF